ncbi:tRNA-specific 2-thiouridylase [Candidatus Falkowbacteria bacterium]|nr:tRNA-specific 2-thiouridylase [Candidatus Falkowbacteria bacterium]
MPARKPLKIAVGMSGGVDSSVAAALLKERGFDVLGVFLHFWSETIEGKIRDNICCSLESQEDARRVCQKLRIPFYTLNMEAPFKEKIVDEFFLEYQNCRTPNPCVRCNQFIKFGEMWKKLRPMNVDCIATGHYALVKAQNPKLKAQMKFKTKNLKSILRGSSTALAVASHLRMTIPSFKLLKGKDKNKDQSYFLHQSTQEQLAHILFPVGDLTKAEVRSLAKKFGLPTASKIESQEICFIPGADTSEFLKRHLRLKKGAIKEIETGRVLGEHDGLALYTIGQRKGIRLAGGPWYVVSFNKTDNVLLVSREEAKISSSRFIVGNVNWISGVEPKFPLKTKCRVRSQASEVDCVVNKNKSTGYRVDLVKPERAITPGQYCVFYGDDECLGGGVIKLDQRDKQVK